MLNCLTVGTLAAEPSWGGLLDNASMQDAYTFSGVWYNTVGASGTGASYSGCADYISEAFPLVDSAIWGNADSLSTLWFTTGTYAGALVDLSGYDRPITDQAWESLSRNAAERRKLISWRRDQAEREIARLEDMRGADAGWDGYAAKRPEETSIDLAAELLRFLADKGAPIPVATMSPNGNASLFMSHAGAYADIELHSDNNVSWLLQLPGGPEIEDSETFDGTYRSLRLIEIMKYIPGSVA